VSTCSRACALNPFYSAVGLVTWPPADPAERSGRPSRTPGRRGPRRRRGGLRSRTPGPR
jgi:hypothetical protein